MNAFGAMQDRRPSLRRFTEPIEMLDWLHGSAARPADKNGVLRDLVLEAQAGDPGDEVAVVLLHLALWPGLDAVHGRLLGKFRDDPDLLVSELSSRFIDQVARLDTGRVGRIAATIVMNTKRDTMRALIADVRDRRRRRKAVDREPSVGLRGGYPIAVPDHREIGQPLDSVAELLRPILGADTDLVIDKVIFGFTLKEIARRHGLSHDAARKRYQRAIARLRDAFPDFP